MIAPAGLPETRMWFLGAIISPGREDDVYPIIEEIFSDGMPALEGSAMVAFLHAFVGLWQEILKALPHNPITLSPAGRSTPIAISRIS